MPTRKTLRKRKEKKEKTYQVMYSSTPTDEFTQKVHYVFTMADFSPYYIYIEDYLLEQDLNALYMLGTVLYMLSLFMADKDQICMNYPDITVKKHMYLKRICRYHVATQAIYDVVADITEAVFKIQPYGVTAVDFNLCDMSPLPTVLSS